MTALPDLPKTARFFIHTQITGGPVATTRFSMTYTGALGGADATTLLGTLNGSWNTRFAPLTGSQYTLIGTQVIDYGSKTGVNVSLPANHAGTATQAGVPAGVCFVMSCHVSFRYRGGHARVYIPGLDRSQMADSNTWTPGFQGTVFQQWTGMLGDLAQTPPVNVGQLAQIVWHQYSSNVKDFPDGHPTTKPPWPLASPVPLTVTSWSANPQVGSQRRRNQQP